MQSFTITFVLNSKKWDFLNCTVRKSEIYFTLINKFIPYLKHMHKYLVIITLQLTKNLSQKTLTARQFVLICCYLNKCVDLGLQLRLFIYQLQRKAFDLVCERFRTSFVCGKGDAVGGSNYIFYKRTL